VFLTNLNKMKNEIINALQNIKAWIDPSLNEKLLNEYRSHTD
jgi:hypothetical protein